MYNNSSNYYLISPILRPLTILTNSYVAAPIISSANQPNQAEVPQLYANNQLALFVNFTKGSLTSATIIVEFSPDGTNWYQETTDDLTLSTGVIIELPTMRVFNASGKYKLTLPIKDTYIRVSALGTGTVTGSLLSIDAVVSNN
jgi:hypothetical protein